MNDYRHLVETALHDLMDEAIKARDWRGAHGLVPSFRRFDLFIALAPRMTPDERSACLAKVWTDCDGIWPNRKAALAYLKEAGYIGSLPKPEAPLTLYRGVSTSRHRLGLSWSTNIDTARSFVRPFGRFANRGGVIYGAVAPLEAFLAGFNDREESEYVVDPALLRSVRQVEIVVPD